MGLRTAEDRQAGNAVSAYAAGHRFDLLTLAGTVTAGVLHPRPGRVAEAAVRDSAVPVLSAP